MNYLPIAFIADSNFFLPTIVAITSLIENKKASTKYKIYIVCVGFSEEQVKKVKVIENKYSVEICITEIDEKSLRDKYSGLVKHDCNATISALIKFDLPDICRDEKTLLYLDGDIIINDDLSDLVDIQFKDNEYVAAVKDSGVLYSDRLKRQKVSDYFNSGVMYLNLDAMRRDELSSKLVEAKMKSTDNSLMDQHVLNEVFGGNKILLDYRYNTLYVNLRRAHYFHSLSLDIVNEFCKQEYCNWEDILNKSIIVHYSSFDKPWKYDDVAGVELWNDYYKKSLVSDIPLSRKHLGVSKIENLMEKKITRIFGILSWELKTKGLKKTIKEILIKIKGRL